jgi:hypothetical protein
MSLVDALMGGVVFAMASTASLQLYGSSLQVTKGRELRQQRAEQMEVALAEGYRRMAELSPNSDCLAVATALATLLQPPTADGLNRTVLVQGDAVRLAITASGLPERSRWYAPAAYGLCEVAP